MFSKDLLHIYLDESSLKIARSSFSQGRKTVQALYYKDLTGVSTEDIRTEIARGAAALGPRVKNVSVVLASKYIITKSIEVPSLDQKEIEDIVRLQAVRHTPYSKEEVIVGYISLDVILERYTKALLVIASNDNIRKKTDLIELLGLNIQSVHLAPEVLTKVVSGVYPEGPLGFLYVDQNSTDIIIINKEKPHFIRSIPVGSKLLKDAANQTLLAEEIKKTIAAYQSEDANSMPKRFLIAGTDAERAVAAKPLEDDFKIKTEIFMSEGKLPISEEAMNVMKSVPQVSFLDVISDALTEDEGKVDLIPEDLKIRKSFRNKGQEIFLAGSFFIVIFILTMSIFLTKIYFRNSYLKEIHKNFQIKEQEAEELVLLSEDTRKMEAFNAKRGRAITVLDQLQTMLPQEMYLSEIMMTTDEKVSIKGTSELMSAVFSFVTEFDANPYFKSVNPDYTKSRKENDKDVSDFGITAGIEGLGASEVAPPVAAEATEAVPADKKEETK